MVDRVDELSSLVGHPPREPAAIAELRARTALRRRRRRVAAGVLSAGLVLGAGALSLVVRPESSSVRIAPPVTSPTTIAEVPTNDGPSQSAADAERDGVPVDLAETPVSIRSQPLISVNAPEGTWAVSVGAPALERQTTTDDGCRALEIPSTWSLDRLCSYDYSEILLLDPSGAILRAYPMPRAKPSWIAAAGPYVYAGRIGDGALPNSTLVRIDRRDLSAKVLVIPADPDYPGLILPTWRVATTEEAESARQRELVTMDDTGSGTPVASYVGRVRVDLEVADGLLDGG